MILEKTQIMCFFTSQMASAEQIARKYGRKMDVIERARAYLAKMEARERQLQQEDPKHKTDVYKIRLTEGMTVIPAYAEPMHVIVGNSDELQVMRWGLIPRDTTLEKRELYNKKNLYKNARAENLFDTWPWKMVTHNRCIIPVTGFYEPHQYPNGKKQYFYIHLRNQEQFGIAGLWDEWTDPRTGEKSKSFAMITIAANKKLSEVHNSGNNPFRMPLIIPDEKTEAWLDPARKERADIEPFLVTPSDNDLEVWPVQLKFNFGDPYDPTKLEEVPPVE